MSSYYESNTGTKLRPVVDFGDDRWVTLSTAEYKKTLIKKEQDADSDYDEEDGYEYHEEDLEDEVEEEEEEEGEADEDESFDQVFDNNEDESYYRTKNKNDDVSIYPEMIRYHFKEAFSVNEGVEAREFGFNDDDAELEELAVDEEGGIAADENNIEEVGAVPDELIQPWDLESIHENVEVRYTESKGRCLYARKCFNPGDIIFAESPLLVVTPELAPELSEFLEDMNSKETFTLPPLWHVAALCTLTMLEEEDKAICLDKWVPDPFAEPSYDVQKIIENTGIDVDPHLYERTLNAWRFNSFNHTSNNGIVLYNVISMMAHNCGASCCWHYGVDNTFVLRAKTRLEVGDEITISYISDDDLFKCSKTRRELLSNWLFYCQCERCNNPTDLSRGLKCASCGVGSMFFKEDENGITRSSRCSVCRSQPDREIIDSYTDLESQYVARLEETDKSDVEDVEAVYQEAQKVFTQHWIMYELDTMLFEAYKESQQFSFALSCLYNRLNFVRNVLPDCTYTLAWITEELGDILSILQDEYHKGKSKTNQEISAIQRYYYDTWCYLSILTGPNHHFTVAAKNKYEAITN
ncbi:SET domain protein [Cryptosporidium meleagridis]|uniref:SET domain protein n=1 Tax=Cryptosporidium meleagridis TaxID=93969 RepID=A0A2P4YX75_9CRYT|nr:SET domain protein [Cryptosporidium meleagridis]